jgi:hypothetical protein
MCLKDQHGTWHIICAQEGQLLHLLLLFPSIFLTGKASAMWSQGLASGLQQQREQEEENSRHTEGPLAGHGPLSAPLSLEGPRSLEHGVLGGLGPSWPLLLAAAVTVGWSRVGRVITSYISGRPDP